jgi:predicted metalloprotease
MLTDEKPLTPSVNPTTNITFPSRSTISTPTTATITDNSGYVNDDYTLTSPGMNAGLGRPEPTTWAEATQLLTDNSLYHNITMPIPVRCELSQMSVMSADAVELKTHFDELTACLMRAWDPTLQKAGFYAVRPIINIYSAEIDSPCGELPVENAAFCSANEQIYYSAKLPTMLPAGTLEANMVVESIISHEFGHAVQNRTGILSSANAWINHYNSQNDKLMENQYSRWLELQADCFAGEFLKSVSHSVGLTEADSDAIALMFYSIGDDVLTGEPNYDGNHGHGQNRVNWLAQGFNQENLGHCNTFIAAAADTK